MNKAFIFDMDGVIVDSEQVWPKVEPNFKVRTFGADVADKIGSTMGLSVPHVAERAKELGSALSKEEIIARYDTAAKHVYEHTSIVEGVEELVQYLLKQDFKIGLVSSSRQLWIDWVLPRLTFSNKIESVISVSDEPGVRSKPYPDAYLLSMKRLNSTPEQSIVLEDSNAGIKGAKASGAFTIGFSGSLTKGYNQEGADMYASTMKEVQSVVESRNL